jgi:hypothetical protein
MTDMTTISVATPIATPTMVRLAITEMNASFRLARK